MSKPENRVVCILMERDGLTEQEATDQVMNCLDLMLETGDDGVLMEELGLEPDYVIDVLSMWGCK